MKTKNSASKSYCFLKKDILSQDVGKKNAPAFLQYAIKACLISTQTKQLLLGKDILYDCVTFLDTYMVDYILNIFDLSLLEEKNRNDISSYLWDKYQLSVPWVSMSIYNRCLRKINREKKRKKKRKKRNNKNRINNIIIKQLKHKLLLERFAFGMFCLELIRDDVSIKEIKVSFNLLADELKINFPIKNDIWMKIYNKIFILNEKLKY